MKFNIIKKYKYRLEFKQTSIKTSFFEENYSMDIFTTQYRVPTDKNVVDFTVNLNICDFKFLAPSNQHGFFSKDSNALSKETAKANILRLWKILGLTQPPIRSKSIAVRVAETKTDGQGLSCYGTVVLVLDINKIADETYIINGDFKSVGYKLQTNTITDEDVLCVKPLENQLAKLLNQYAYNNCKGQSPRLFGTYFEARVTRGLRISDVAKIYVPKDEEAALRKAIGQFNSNKAV